MAGAGIGAAALTCAGLTALGTHTPMIDMYESEREGGMNDRVLIVYASKCGSTGEVAKVIADELTARGKTVDVRLAKNASTVEGYRAVIVGSAIRIGRWLPEAVRFVELQQQVLRQLPTAFFAVHMENLGDDENSRKNRLAYLDPVREIVPPQYEGFFAGKVDLAQLSLIERTLAKAAQSQIGDLRDWDKIRRWGNTILT